MRPWFVFAFCGLCSDSFAAGPQFRLERNRVQILAGSEVVLESPVEGLWSVACDWKDGWPADWHHAGPSETRMEGEWTILRGEIKACGGAWAVEDAYRLQSGAVRGLRRFTWKGANPVSKVTLSVRFEAKAEAAQPVLPGIVYFGNPSGARSGRVPVTTGKPGEEALYEEHRFLELYDLTHDPVHLGWARHACDVMLTYTYVWDAPQPAGRLSDHRVRTRDWTAVSPQNQHLDVWGVFAAPEVYWLGQIDGREDLKKLAVVMYRSCGQMIDAHGSQGEQLQQTNYAQRNVELTLTKFRGGYNESWTVFWITAHFLTGGARFLELGVPVWE